MRNRARIIFRKSDRLRFIGHRDLVRVFERMLRRSGVGLALSQGFHPKAKLSFPLALGLGIEGCQESLDVEFSHPIAADELGRMLREEAPDGLEILEVRTLAETQRKAVPVAVDYCLPVPPQRLTQLGSAIQSFMQQESVLVQRKGRKQPINARQEISQMGVDDGRFYWSQRVTAKAAARPNEVVALLGLADLLEEGGCIKRTQIHWANDDLPADPPPDSEGSRGAQ